MTMVSDSQQSELVSKLRTYYERSRHHKKKLYDRWSRSWRLVNNRYGGATSTWMPQPRDSQIYPVCASLVGWMTDQRTAFEISASVDPNSPNYTFLAALASDLERIMATNWNVEHYGSADRMVIWDALLYGAGIYKAVWDPDLSDGYGNANLVRVDPWAFYPDPTATSERDMNYCIEVRRMSYDELERRYPDARITAEAGGILAAENNSDQRPSLDFADSPPMANPGALPGGNTRWSGRRPGREPGEADSVVVYEYWLRENRETDPENEDDDPEVVSTWRMVVVANGNIIMDEMAEDLWEAGIHPYVRYPFDDLGEFWGTSLVEHLAHPQIYLNRLLTALQHNAELTGNPIFVDPANSGLDRVAVVNRPGQRLRVNSSAMGGAGTGPSWLRPPDMPDGVRALVEYWGNRMKAIAGLEAFDMPKDRQGERTVNQAQEAAFVRVRDAIRARERALAEVGTLLANLVVENYSTPRTISIVGNTGERTSMALVGRHFWAPSKDGATPLKFILNVQAGSSRPTNRAQRANEAQVLRSLQAIDTLSFLQMLEVPNAPEIFKRLQQEQASGAPQPGARQRARK